MHSFLDNRPNFSKSSESLGKVSDGGAFKKFTASQFTGNPEDIVSSNAAKRKESDSPKKEQPVTNPDGPDAPKVSFTKDGDTITRIKVSFGEQTVEIDCQYE